MKTTPPAAGLLLAVFLGWLWAVLINHLRVEWTLNPQYGYGWAVPFLCAYLIWQSYQKAENRKQKTENSVRVGGFQLSAFSFQLLIVLLALLYAPTRLVEQANPDWRLVSWALALDVVGLTLLLIYLVGGASWLKRLAFPVGFFLVTVPWPTLVEGPVIQGLTRTDASVTVELMGWLGIPALPHGNVIEVATGEVGIDEACSGIRSFQATLMLSLFLGELYQLTFPRRLGLVASGFALAFVFNLARMSTLVWVAAHHGIGAIAQWHDPTGITILLACFFALWGLGLWLGGGGKRMADGRWQMADGKISLAIFPISALAFALVGWLAAVEISVEGWYRWHEARVPPAAQWTVAWPTNNPTFKMAGLPENTRRILRYDEGWTVHWEAEGLNWQAIFLRWNPGQTALHLAQNHTPQGCLTAAGNTVTTITNRVWLDAAGLQLPFTVYALEHTSPPVFVFYCLWDDRASTQGRGALSLNYGNRLTPVRQGLRNPGQRSLELVLSGNLDRAQAEAAVQNLLPQIIRSGPVNAAAAIK
ncbi:MAG: exosortase/archaeosortase family protein [Verrucomicrobiae bacterium]